MDNHTQVLSRGTIADLGGECRQERAPGHPVTRERALQACRKIEQQRGQELRATMLVLEREAQPPQWLVDGRLPRIGTSLLVGDPGSGKSTLARSLALSVARGTPFVGFETLKGRVMFVSPGSRLERLREKFRAEGLTGGDDVSFLGTRPLRGTLERMHERALSVRPALIVLDGVQCSLGIELAGTGNQRAPLEQLSWAAAYTRSHILVVQDLARGPDQNMGAAVRSGERGLDTILLLHTEGERRMLGSIQRIGEDLAKPVPVPVIPAQHLAEPLTVPQPPEQYFGDPVPDPDAAPGKVLCTKADPLLAGQVLTQLKLRATLVSTREICLDLRNEDPESIVRVLEEMHGAGRLIRVGSGEDSSPYRFTGFDSIPIPGGSGWLRRVRPWADVRTLPSD